MTNKARRSTRGAWRLLRCVLKLGAGITRCAVVFPFSRPDQRMRQTGNFCRQMLNILGVQVESAGPAHQGAMLVVANHISWLDIAVINAVQPARFVSKSDVRHWPVLGWLVAAGGTMFIERERKRDAMRVVHQTAEALKQGDVIAVFPEGTTGDGQSLLPFHANLLQAAISAGVPVQPFAISYADADSQPSQAVVWIGDTTLIGSLWDVVTAEGLKARVVRRPVVSGEGLTRRELARDVRDEIGGALGWRETPNEGG